MLTNQTMHSRHMSAAVSQAHRGSPAACPGLTDDVQMCHQIQYIWQSRWNEIFKTAELPEHHTVLSEILFCHYSYHYYSYTTVTNISVVDTIIIDISHHVTSYYVILGNSYSYVWSCCFSKVCPDWYKQWWQAHLVGGTQGDPQRQSPHCSCAGGRSWLPACHTPPDLAEPSHPAAVCCHTACLPLCRACTCMATCSFALLPVWQHVAVPWSPTAVHCCTACLPLWCACTCAATCSFALNCKLAMRCHTACLRLYDACNCMGDRWMCGMCLRVIYMCIAIVFNKFSPIEVSIKLCFCRHACFCQVIA